MTSVRLSFACVMAVLALLAWHDSRVGTLPVARVAVNETVVPAAFGMSAPDAAELARHALFGTPPPSSAAPAREPGRSVEELPESAASYRLFGVISARGDVPRFALIGTDEANQLAYREGDSAPDGARVEAILDRAVVLSRNGQQEQLPLQEALGTGGNAVESLPAAEVPTLDDESPPPPTRATTGTLSPRLEARLKARRAATKPP